MITMIAIAFGGALGALARYSVGIGAAALLGPGFPLATLLVNVLGSFTIGLCYVFFVESADNSGVLRAFIMVGFLGAFTTFSTFSVETLQLLESGQLAKSLLNVASNVAFCLLACWMGLSIAR